MWKVYDNGIWHRYAASLGIQEKIFKYALRKYAIGGDYLSKVDILSDFIFEGICADVKVSETIGSMGGYLGRFHGGIFLSIRTEK